MVNVNLKLLVGIALAVHGQASSVYNEDLSPIEVRQLQQVQTLKYRATYRADFQHLLDPSCNTVASPLIGVQCLGSNMTILSTSDPSIDCIDIPLGDPKVNGTLYGCYPSCITDDCDSIYRARNASTFFDGPFGSVTFMCEGDDYRNVSANLLWLAENTTCDSSSVSNRTRNYHAGRLGVSCPEGSDREYVFDDAYFECFSYAPPVNTAIDESGDDVYTCISGNDCGGEACDITIQQMSFSSHVPIFLDTCVEKTTAVTTTSPSLSPVSDFEYSAQFEAHWAVLFSSEETELSCTNAHGGVIIRCEGGSSIQYLGSSDTSMSCPLLSDNELSCVGSEDGIKNQFTRVNYECSGKTIPSSQLTFLQSTSVCGLVLETATVSHAVVMGISCSSETIYFDGYTECGEASHQFYAGSNEFGFDTDYLMCSEAASFSLGTSTTPQIIPNVTIRTDDIWLRIPERRCFNISSAVENPISLSPISVPTTQRDVVFPTLPISSTKVPTLMPALSETTTVPITSREAPPSSTSMNQSVDDGSNGAIIGIVVGCVGGGFILSAMIGYFVFFRKRDTNSSLSKAKLTITDISSNEAQVNDDFPHPPPPQPTRAETTSNHFVHPTPAVVAPMPTAAKQVTSSDGYVVELKDQCRSVAFPNGQNRNDRIQPNVVATEPTVIPIVEAYGVSAVSAGSNNRNRSQQEPPGRQHIEL